MRNKPSPVAGTPLPRVYRDSDEPPRNSSRSDRHRCRYPDAEVLFEDVRQGRKRRWWIGTFAIAAFCGSILTLFLLIFNTGQAVGAAKQDITQIKAEQVEAKVDRERITREQDEAERVTNERYERINSMLIRLEEQLKTLNRRMDERYPNRRR